MTIIFDVSVTSPICQLTKRHTTRLPCAYVPVYRIIYHYIIYVRLTFLRLRRESFEFIRTHFFPSDMSFTQDVWYPYQADKINPSSLISWPYDKGGNFWDSSAVYTGHLQQTSSSRLLIKMSGLNWAYAFVTLLT